MKKSKKFQARYGGFCVLCGTEIVEGDFACFVEDELAHNSCAEDEVPDTHIPEFTFNPREWS